MAYWRSRKSWARACGVELFLPTQGGFGDNILSGALSGAGLDAPAPVKISGPTPDRARGNADLSTDGCQPATGSEFEVGAKGFEGAVRFTTGLRKEVGRDERKTRRLNAAGRRPGLPGRGRSEERSGPVNRVTGGGVWRTRHTEYNYMIPVGRAILFRVFFIHGTTMKTEPNQAIRALRKVIGQTQVEFAAMIGASKHTVVSWETGRNKLSSTFARRIAFATGVAGDCLLRNVSTPIYDDPLTGPKEYTAEDFERYRQTTRGRSDAEGARQHLEHCRDTLELVLLAATESGEGQPRHRLPGVLDSFIQWCEQTREDFGLGPAIDEQLRRRRCQAGVTLTYREWRRMMQEDAEAVKGVGFEDDERKGDAESLRLVLELAPGWTPGRSMKPPAPAVMKLATGKATTKAAESEKTGERSGKAEVLNR